MTTSTSFIALTGELTAHPEETTTAKGIPMGTGKLLVAFPAPWGQETEPLEAFDVLAFGKQAASLVAHSQGDTVAVAGKLELTRTTTADGTGHTTWKIIAASVIGAMSGEAAKALAPPAGKRWADNGSRPRPSLVSDTEETAESPFDDGIPF